MANADKNFDQYFRDKLVNHEIKPSKLAWERLDSQLGKKGKVAALPFMRIAASIILLLGLGYIIWQISRTEQLSEPQIAESIQTPVQEEVFDTKIERQNENEISNEDINDFAKPQTMEKEKVLVVPTKKPQLITKPVAESPKELLADHSGQVERNQEQSIGIPELDLPELKLDEALAMNDALEQEYEEVVEYKIIIKSKGLKDEASKQGLIGGIEDKVDKIGGFLNKVEQGFADLQDAKENLFASNIPRKERNK